MRIPAHIGRRLHRMQHRLLAGGMLNAEEITLAWTDVTPATGWLPDIEGSAAAPTVTPRTAIARAFVHYVNIHQTGYTRHAQIERGDVILDFPGDVDLDGKSGLRFIIGGRIYVQKDGGDELAASWDVRCGGTAITRTVLCTLLS